MDKFSEEFNEHIEKIRSMFVVSQIMAKDGFKNTLESMKNKNVEVKKKTIDINQIRQLGLMLTATTANDIDRLKAIVNCLNTFV